MLPPRSLGSSGARRLVEKIDRERVRKFSGGGE